MTAFARYVNGRRVRLPHFVSVSAATYESLRKRADANNTTVGALVTAMVDAAVTP